MNKTNYFAILAFIFICMNFISAEPIGQRQDGKLDTQYYISQPCASCSYINISVFTKDGIVLDNVPMVDNGTSWIYNFTPTTTLRHDVNGIGDINSIDDSFAFWFGVTLSGEQTNTTIIISDIILLLFFIGLIFLIHNNHKKTDFEEWNKDIIKEHKNMGQTMARGLVYNLFKNTFLFHYFIGWLLILVLKDIVYRFNSAAIYSYFTLAANIYSLGLLLVLVFMIGNFASFVKDTINTLSDNNWGVGDGE